MKLVRPIDLVFLSSLALFLVCGAAVELNGGVGPCGPSTDSLVVSFCWIPSLPLGFLGMIVCGILSLASVFRKSSKSSEANKLEK